MPKKHSTETRAKISAGVRKSIESRSSNGRIEQLANSFSSGLQSDSPVIVRNYGGLSREVNRSVPQQRPEGSPVLSREQLAEVIAGESNIKRVPTIATLHEGEHGGKIRPPELLSTQRFSGREIRGADTSNKITEK